TLDERREDDRSRLDVVRRLGLTRDPGGHLGSDLADADARADHRETDREAGAHEPDTALGDSVLNSLEHQIHGSRSSYVVRVLRPRRGRRGARKSGLGFSDQCAWRMSPMKTAVSIA